ncbi:CsgG/HfaB family protein [Hydrogenophaga sp. OTU3427]|uniref:CsgG/HfaB family protein n=1 Tax=Hydrogenophaga sp. OTU3427 TaxID=3043856 RepID=UPI00313F202C
MKRVLPLAAATLCLSGCIATAPTIGSPAAQTAATGSAGGATAQNANSQLERCDATLGTLAVVEDQQASWYSTMQSYKLRSTVPLLRMLIQQSNCFVVVERGMAMRNLMQERSLEQSGEMRAGSNFGKGQMVSADYTMNPSITFSEKGTGGVGAALRGYGGALGAMLGGGLKFNDASTTLTLIDNRSGVQLAAAEGSSRNTDFNLFGGLFGGSGSASGSGFSDTPEGKVLTAAFVDSYNQLVRAVRNYKAQEVKGGLGTGGRLGVQGGGTPAAATPAIRKK